MGEERPQLGLEEDHEEDDPDGLQARDDPVERVQAEPLGDDRGDHDEDEAHEHLRRAGSLDHGEEAIEEERHDQDVDHVDQDLRFQLDHARVSRGGKASGATSRSASAARSASKVSRTSWVRKIRAPSP